jgi:hypothetical protein
MEQNKEKISESKESNKVNIVNIVNTNDKVDEYIKQLNPLEQIAYEIAKSRLKTSFDIEKSIGFKSFH